MASSEFTSQTFNIQKGHIVIIGAFFDTEITSNLVDGCLNILSNYPGVKHAIYEVPGAFEIPLLAQKLAQGDLKNEVPDVIITLGCVVKGDTYHFEMVANEVARGCMDVMLKTGVPVVMDVLAPYNREDGLKRSIDPHNHGVYAANAALRWLEILNR